MSGLPVMATRHWVSLDAVANVDAGTLADFQRVAHVDALARRGYAPFGDVSIRRISDDVMRTGALFLIRSETSVAWRAP